MDNVPTEAPTPAPAEASVAAPTTPNTEPASAPAELTAAPDMHGFTSDELAKIRTFFDNNGGFSGIKEKISRPSTTTPEAQYQNPTSQPQYQQPQPQYQQTYRPQGAITQDELAAQYYFERLSKNPEFSTIADEISGGAVLTEMAKLGIPFRNQDGSWNNDRINDYLSLRAKTVPAKPTGSEPDASAAPTVTYTQVGDGGIKSIDEAYKIIMEKGNPNSKAAEDFIKNSFNKK